jgi:membrane-associated phospholipid phosphatase
MTVDQHELYVHASRSETPVQGSVRRLLRELAPQDFVVFIYLLVLNAAVLSAPAGAARISSLTNVMSLLVLHIATVVAVRSKWLTQRHIAPLLYRVVVYGCVQLTYFMFAELLPLVNPRALDHQLYALDIRLFGVEPAEYFDRFVTPATTEWFAFFYFSYFFLLAMHVLPILFLTKRASLLAEFALGVILLFCIGHTVYMLVPGYGPYRAMPELFQHQLSPGIWWNTTKNLVAHEGAQKDIFPSLHTAAPTFLVLFSFHRRGQLPFRYTWPVVAFFGANIVIATMFLRWHYVIDVVAGLLLAYTAHSLAVFLCRRESARREALGLGPMWPQWP